ncbi:putative autotransporter serine protease [Campylobacter pinnipediorum subsp. pinnipediorum]|uniref:autotransporter serine protease n=1 Tax=Campylobacter pinnipediorum TaxID=1965231 RepID=UPI000994ABFB|nr:autotransporter serine protease [Campylobacter pinnipediorum]AQW83949.1 putative autotransporter serine protease [Campylobacter pinnipediorum subsp. pinnipediorum]
MNKEFLIKSIILLYILIFISSCSGGGGGGGGGGDNHTIAGNISYNTRLNENKTNNQVVEKKQIGSFLPNKYTNKHNFVFSMITNRHSNPLNTDYIDENKEYSVAVIDNGFYPISSFEFENKQDVAKNNSKWRAKQMPNKKPSRYISIGSHGTAVTATLIENLNSKSSKIYLYDGGFGQNETEIVNDSEFYTNAYKNGVRIFNQSFGSSLNEERGTDLSYLVKDMPEKDSIFVWAAGNDGVLGEEYSNHASPQALYPLLRPNAQNGWIAVAAVDDINNISSTNQLASYSSQIGEKAKTWGITAQGRYVFKNNGYMATEYGTSFATPMVSATVSNVWEKFPWMSNHLVLVSILSTANIPGTTEPTKEPTAKFGWGILNKKRALSGPALFDKRLFTNKDDNTRNLLRVKFDHRDYQNIDKLTWGNDIKGDGGILKEGGGTLYFSGNNSYRGDTVIREGMLVSQNKIINSSIEIEQDGTFLAKHKYKDSMVEVGNDKNYMLKNNGNLVIYGKGLKINGGYKGKKSSSIFIDIDKSLLEVKETLDMGQGKLVADIEEVTEVISKKPTKRTIISAKTISNYNKEYDVTSNVSKYININELYLKDNAIKINYNRNSSKFVLNVLKNKSLTAFNGGEIFDTIADSVSNNTNKNLQNNEENLELKNTVLKVMNAPNTSRMLQSISGEIYASSQNILFNHNLLTNISFSNRVSSLSIINSSGFWYDGMYANSKINTKNYTKAISKTKGNLFGVDSVFSDYIFGIGFVHANTDTKFNNDLGNIYMKNKGIMLYSSKDLGYAYILGVGGLNNVSSSVNREVINKRVDSKFDSKVYNLYTEIGVRKNIDNILINPFIANQATRIKRNDFEEKYEFGSLKANSKRYSSNYVILGLRTSLNLQKLNLNSNVFYSYNSNPANFDFKAKVLANGYKDVAVKGAGEPKDKVWFGIGGAYKINQKVSLQANYNLSIENRNKTNLLNLGVYYKF